MKNKYKLITILGAFSLLLTSCNISTGGSSTSSSKEPEKYTVTWKNFDGVVLESDEDVLEGTVPTYDGPTPVKNSDAQYNYVWSGWTPEVKAATGNVEYLATFKEETRSYTVTWKNEDGKVLKTEEVPYGTLPSYTGDNPTKESTVEHSYTFEKWSPAITEVVDNAEYVASFKEEVRKYTITWKNDNGSIIKTDDVPYGTLPEYTGDEPLKTSDPQFSYKFKEWVPAVATVSGDAEYVASYDSEIRKYTITWKNYDGSVLKVDEDVPYGTLPSYTGATPKRAKSHGFEYTWNGWEPSVLYVTGDAEYVASYSSTPTFCFETWDYELEDGYTLNNLNGAPWINTNITGEIHKIKKPSEKDDFYTAINYDTIKYGGEAPFDDCEWRVEEAFDAINDGTAHTTNSDILYKSFTKMIDGDPEGIKNSLDNFNLNTYLSTKDIFASQSSFLRLVPQENGYELQFNDGYLNGSNALPRLWFYAAYYTDYDSIIKGLANKLSGIYSLGLDASAINDVKSIESTMVNTAYNNQYNSDTTSYTVNTIPWEQAKSALLDLGLASNEKIVVRNYYKNSLNYLFNTYAVNNVRTLTNAMKCRIAFDTRFAMGVEKYRSINTYISQSGLFEGERNIANNTDEKLGKLLAKAGLNILQEQAYIELEGDAEIKQEVTELIEQILEGYERLADQSWLSTRTKNKMKSKLEHMGFASCYSDGFKNFPKIEIADEDAASAYDILKQYNNCQLQTIKDKTADLTGYWDDFHSYTVNAYYSPGQNIFVILNAIVKGLMGESIEEKYGMIGAVIGHEITHAFDSTGSQFDENGNYNDWWTSADRKEFNKKVNNLVSFYNKISLKKGYKANGDTVDGEATADMGGVKVMLLLAKEIEDFDYKKFFEAYARVWCDDPISINSVEERASDAHPFNYLRANVTVAQFDEFVEAFNVQPGDGMYIPESQRVKIW